MESSMREEIIREAHASEHEGCLEAPTHQASARNPLCGDELKLELLVDDSKKLITARTQTRACLITSASAHALARTIEGLSVSQARQIAEEFIILLTNPEANAELHATSAELRKFEIFHKPHPRHHCALLSAQALLQALGLC